MFEDDTFFGDMMATKFAMEGFRVRWFEHPTKDVVALVAREQPDVISMSVIMPVMDGFAAVPLLKEDSRTKHIPIFFLTTLGAQQDIQRGRSLGADDYIIKAETTPSIVVEKARALIAGMTTDLSSRHTQESLGPVTVTPPRPSVSAGLDMPLAESLRWYFVGRPRVVFTVLLFILLAVNTVGYGIWAIGDIIKWFQAATWGALGLVVIGLPVIGLFFLPAWTSYWCFLLFPAINESRMSPWRKVWANVGLLALAAAGTTWIRIAVLAIFNV